MPNENSSLPTPILITGAGGFVGRNLVATLHAMGCRDLMLFEKDDTVETLADYCRQAAFVVHLAGINRPKNPSEFYSGNAGLTDTMLHLLEKSGNRAPVLVTSSIQAALDNDYGKSKKQAEDAIFAHGKNTGAPVYVFRMEGVFGKWCRPNYNSVVATFCHNIARDLPIEVRDPAYELPLVYIDDVIACILDALQQGKAQRDEEGYCRIHPVHRVTLGRLAELIRSFAEARKGSLAVPYLAEGSFEKKLYSTYLSYLPTDQFAYDLNMHCDDRGSFTEVLRTAGARPGQREHFQARHRQGQPLASHQKREVLWWSGGRASSVSAAPTARRSSNTASAAASCRWWTFPADTPTTLRMWAAKRWSP